MKKIKILSYIVAICPLLFASASCNKWLDVISDDEVFEDDAFSSTKGYRSALIGIYKTVASSSLYGQELTWGLKSTMSWNYQSGYSATAYRTILSEKTTDNTAGKNIADKIWSKAYYAIANCNELLQQIDGCEDEFEYSWEKSMIMAEARGLRGLLHFELLQLFVPAPVTGYTGTALPYVTTYPDLKPEYKSMSDYLALVIEDLKYAQETLAPIDIDELRNKSHFVSGSIRLDNMDYVLFQAVGNIHSDGAKRDNAYGDGFFAYRGYRFNYWSATGLLARVYSYMRDFDNAETYASTIIDDWVVDYQFNLYSSNPKAATNPARVDGKRRPEPILAFWNDQVCDDYVSVVGTSYDRMVELKYLFDGDLTTDYRYTDLYNTSNKRYRVWDESDDRTVSKYSNPLLPAMELPEVYYIKAECLAQKGDISGADALIQKVRNARGCTAALGDTDLESFMNTLVNEAQRDFLTRGTTFCFLKKFDWPVIYNGTPAGWTVPEGWYVLPIPDSETAYY
jgi:starch-binding outer membrane protein, SusD/RagB family